MLMIILGIGKLIDLGTGLNSQILQLSKHWKIDLLTNMGFVALAIVLNYMLTKNYGIMGTAIGSGISILAFNAVRFVFIRKIYGMQPFNLNNLKALIAAAALLFPLIFLLPIDNVYAGAGIKSTLFILFYGIAIIRLNLSDDLTTLMTATKAKFLGKQE